MKRPFPFASAVLLGVLLSPSLLRAAGESNEVTVEQLSEAAPETRPEPTFLPVVETELLGSKNADSVAKPVTLSSDAPPADASTADTSAPDSLRDALAYVYEHHPQLMAEREKLKATEESIWLAISDFRPNVAAAYSKGRERTSSNDARWSYGDTESRGLTVTQPIFSGLDGVAGLKAARQRVKAGRADLTALEQQVLYNTVVAYTGVAEAEEVLKLNQNNVDVLTKQRDATKVRFDVGELTKTDVSQAEARLASAKADEQQAVGDVAIARASFMRAAGFAAPDAPAMPALPAGLPKDITEANALAHAASPTLEAARRREKAFAEDIGVRVGAFIPDVSVQGTVRRTEGGNGFTRSYDSDELMLNVAIPLYQSGAEYARLREARKIASQAKYTTMDTMLAVEQDVASAWQNYITSESVITSTQAAKEAATLALEGVRQENEFGVRTVLDVLDAEQELMNTNVNLIRATRNYKIQAYRLLASVGKLTAHELALPVKYFESDSPDDHVKNQLLGW